MAKGPKTKPSSIEIFYPLTSQTLSLLKKDLKSNPDRADNYLDILLSEGLENNQGSKQQMNYILQLCLACLDEMADVGRYNKSITRFLSFSLFSESYSISVALHNLIHGKACTKLVKSSQCEHILVMRNVASKSKQQSPSTICIYLINLVRIFIALQMHLKHSISEFIDSSEGLSFWMRRLKISDKVTEASLSDHIFRLLYSAIFSSGGTYIADDRTLGHCVQFYYSSNKYQASVIDKVLAQSFKYLTLSLKVPETIVFEFFRLNAFTRISSFRPGLLRWLDPLLRLNWKNSQLIEVLKFIDSLMGEDAKSITFLIEILRQMILGNAITSNRPLVSTPLELQPLFCSLLSILNKRAYSIVDPLFQDCLLGRSSKISMDMLPFQMFVESLAEFEDQGDERVVSVRQTSIIILSMSLFIQGKSDTCLFSLWNECLMDPSLASRIGSISYNIGASISASKQFNRALDYFNASIRSYVALLSSDVKKELKSWQGKAQTLLKLSRFEDCISVILQCFQKFGDSVPDLEKVTKNLLSLYVSAALNFDPYISLCSKLQSCTATFIQLELQVLSSLSNSPSPRLQILDHALSLDDIDTLARCKFLLLQSELIESSKSEAIGREILRVISDYKSTSVQEKLLLNYISSMVYANFGILTNLNDECWLHYLFGCWNRLLDLKDQLRKDSAILNQCQSCASQVFDYLVGSHNLKSSIRVHSICVQFCELRQEGERIYDLLSQYLKIADVYIELGYSGRAGEALNSAKAFLNKADAKSKSQFYSVYTGYLISIGNYSKAQDIRPRVGSDDVGTEDNLDARIELHTGNIYSASEKSTLAYRSMMKVLKCNPFSSPYFFIQLFKSLFLLCNILFLQGLPLHVEYYLNQGLSIAKRSRAPTSFLLLEFARFLKRKGCFSASLEQLADANVSKDNFALLNASLLLTRGEILVNMGDNNAGEVSFLDASSVIDLELEVPSHPSLEEAFQNSLTIKEKPSVKQSSRSIGLEIFKGNISAHLGSVLFKNGKFEQSENTFKIAKSLPLTPYERCLYLSEVAKIRTHQFFENYSAADQSGVFQESVIRLEKGMKRRPKVKAGTTLKRIDQLDALLNEAYSSVCKYGGPDDAQQLAYCLFKLYLFRSNVAGDCENYHFDSAFSAMELPKCIFQRRQAGHQVGSLEEETVLTNAILNQIDLSGFIVCSISMDISGEVLCVSRCDSSVKTLFKLPIRRFAIREGYVNGDGLSFPDAMAEFEEIMKVNKETTSGAKLCVTHKQKKEWLEKRTQLNKDLECFLEKIENEWLAAFRGLFGGVSFTACKLQLAKFQSRLEKMIISSIGRCLKSKAEMKILSVELSICELALVGLGPNPSFENVEDILYFILDGYQLQGIPIEYDEICIEDMRDDLKAMTELFYKEATSTLSSLHKPIVLVLDKHIQHLPWESIPIMRGRPVSRVSSLQMLQDCLRQRRTIDPQNSYFILNPSGDLVKTQSKMTPHLSRWKGISGRSPSKEEFKSGLERSDLFLYFGHGGGEAYIDCNEIPKLDRIPSILLFGCSSGFLKGLGEFDCMGIAREYMHAGSSLVLGNLWDVTDVDIDRYALSLMEQSCIIGSNSTVDELSIVSACNSSRVACNLSFIVGAAPVIYGIPRGQFD